VLWPVAIFAVAVTLLAATTFMRATTPRSVLPDADYWANIFGLITEAGVDFNLAALFRHNNEHLVVIPKLIYIANYVAASGSNIGLISYSIVAGGLCAALLLIFTYDLFRDAPWRLVLCAVLFPIVMFSAKLTHSYFYGMSGTIWLTADLFVLASAAALARAAATGRASWLYLSLVAAILGILSYSTAIYMLLVLLVFSAAYLAIPSLRGRLPRTPLVATLLASSTLLAIVVAYAAHGSTSRPSSEFNSLQLIDFVLIYIGGALAEGPWRGPAGVLILAAGAAAITVLIRQDRGREILLWSILYLFAPFNALMSGFGRLGTLGLNAAGASRYQSVTAISLIATSVLVLAALPKSSVPLRAAIVRAIGFLALIGIGIIILVDRSFLRSYTARNANKAITEIALRQGIEDIGSIQAATPAAGELMRMLPALRAARHVPFDRQTRCEDWIGKAGPPSGPGSGAIEAVSLYRTLGSQEALALSGWAVEGGIGAECIAVADGDGTVIGAGASAFRRADLKSVERRPSARIGWKAVARLPRGQKICAYALFPGTDTLAKLPTCQAVAGVRRRTRKPLATAICTAQDRLE
jgi:hypothetical protein